MSIEAMHSLQEAPCICLELSRAAAQSAHHCTCLCTEVSTRDCTFRSGRAVDVPLVHLLHQ